jgi:hypothetical protein
MPQGDGTGPNGKGPMTGRGAGKCAGIPVQNDLNPPNEQDMEISRGTGGGRGGQGRGKGSGSAQGNRRNK